MSSERRSRILVIGAFVPAMAGLSGWGALSSSSSVRPAPHAITGAIQPGDEATKPKAPALQTYAKLPLSFEANRGQTDSRVQFLARGSGYTLLITSTEAVLILRKAEHAQLAVEKRESSVLQMQLVGANPQPRVIGLEELPGKSNYLVGSDPQKWRTGIPHYGRVRCEGVYPGVDLIYYGNGRQLEYDFVVAAGADPDLITLSFAGAEHVRLGADGELVLGVRGGEIRQHKPVIYQEVAGVRQQVTGHYAINAKNQVRIEVGDYDAERPLVIDPLLGYSTYLGGSSDDNGFGIAVDRDGNAYVMGFIESTDFPTKPGAFQTANGGGLDAFVTKLNRNGTALIYSTYLGGGSRDQGFGIAVDPDGNAYVAGSTDSTDFPTTPDAFQTANAGGTDAFVAKLNRRGTALTYSTYLGGDSSDQGFGIAVDQYRNAYVAGSTDSTDFPTTPGAFQTTVPGAGDGFVTKLNRRGSALTYSTYLGGSVQTSPPPPPPPPGQPPGDLGRGIRVDSEGHAFVTGDTDSTDFPTTPNAFQTVHGGLLDAFVAKLNRSGSGLVYSSYLGGGDIDFGLAIALNRGSAYVTGRSDSADFPTTPGAFQTTAPGAGDGFVTKVNRPGTSLIYSTYLGGADFDQSDPNGIQVDRSGRAYVSGFTLSTDFPTTPGAFQTANAGAIDAFVTNLSPNGAALRYSTYLGGSSNDFGVGIAVDRDGSAYVTGITNSTDFPTTPPAFQTANAGAFDAFVARIDLGRRSRP